MAEKASRWPDIKYVERGRGTPALLQYGRRDARHVLSWSGWRQIKRPATASIQNVLGRLLISQDFLPRSVTAGRFHGTLRNKGFSRASVTTGRRPTTSVAGDQSYLPG